MVKVALSTGSLYTYGLARVFELAAEAGFDAIELMVDQRWDSRHPAYLRRLSEENGLPIAVVHSPFLPGVPGWPRDPVGRLCESVALARALGAGVVVSHLPLRFRAARIELLGFQKAPLLLPIPLPNQSAYRDFLLNSLTEFEEAEEIVVGVENMPARRLLGRRLDLYALNNVDTLSGLPHLTFDTTHIGTWGLDLLETYRRLQARIVHVHLSNFNGLEHQLLDNGHLPLGELLRQLERDRYEGTVSVELGPEALQAEDEGQVLAHLQQVVAFCREHTSKE